MAEIARQFSNHDLRITYVSHEINKWIGRAIIVGLSKPSRIEWITVVMARNF